LGQYGLARVSREGVTDGMGGVRKISGRRARCTRITERKIGELTIRKLSLAAQGLLRRCGSEFSSAEILPLATSLSGRAVKSR